VQVISFVCLSVCLPVSVYSYDMDVMSEINKMHACVFVCMLIALQCLLVNEAQSECKSSIDYIISSSSSSLKRSRERSPWKGHEWPNEAWALGCAGLGSQLLGRGIFLSSSATGRCPLVRRRRRRRALYE